MEGAPPPAVPLPLEGDAEQDPTRELIQLALREVEALGGRPRELVDLHHLLGLVLEQRLGDERQALQHVLEAHRLDPEDLAVLRSLRRLHWQREDWLEVVRLLDSEANRAPRALRAGLLLAQGKVLELGLLQREQACGVYLNGFAQDPSSLPLLRKVQRSLPWHPQKERLLELCAGSTSAGDGRLRSLLWRRIGLYREAHGLDGAEEAHRQAVAADPSSQAAAAALGRVLRRLGRWEELADLLVTRAEGIGRPELAANLLLQAADLLQHRLGREERANELVCRALAGRPGLAQLAPGILLLPGGEAREQLLGRLERQASSAAAPPEVRAGLRLAMARLCLMGPEGACDEAGAFAQVARSLELACGGPEAMELLADLALATEHVEESLLLLRQAAGRMPEASRRAELLVLVGELEEALGAPAEAAASYREALVLGASGANLPALEGLSRLLDNREDLDALVMALERLAEEVNDRAQAAGLIFEAGDLLDFLAPGRDGAYMHARAFELEPSLPGLKEALERGLYRRRDGEGLVRVWREAVAGEQEPRTRQALLLRLAWQHEQQEETKLACELLEDAASLADSWLVTHELARVRGKLGRFREAVAALEAEAGLCRAEDAATGVLIRVVELKLRRLRDPEAALATFVRLFQAERPTPRVLAVLDLLLQEEVLLPRLAELLAQGTRASAELPGGGSASPGEDGRLELLLRLARIQEQTGDCPGALETLRRVLDRDPHHLGGHRSLARLLQELQRWQEAAARLQEVLLRAQDADLLWETNRDLALLFRDHLSDPSRAISCCQNMLLLRPEDQESLAWLLDLLRGQGDLMGAVRLMFARSEVSRDPEERTRLYNDIADLYEDGLCLPEEAVTVLGRALELEPTHLSTLEHQERILASMGRWADLAQTLERFLSSLPVDQQGKGIRQRMTLGELLWQRLDQPARGLEQFRAVMDIAPAELEARLAAADLLLQERRLDEALAEHRELLGIDPLNVRSLRQIRSIWSQSGELHAADAALELLVYLGQASESELRSFQQVRERGFGFPIKPLEPSVFETVLAHPDEHMAGRRVLSLLGLSAQHLTLDGPASILLKDSSRPDAGSRQLLSQVVQDLRTLLGVSKRVELYVSRTVGEAAVLLPTFPSSLLVGRALAAEEGILPLRREVARAMALLRMDTEVAWQRNAEQLELLIQAACLATEVPFDRQGRPRREVVALASFIKRSLSGEALRLLRERGRALRGGRRLDFKAWAEAMEHTANRCSLWATGDLASVMDRIRREPGAGPPPPAPEGGTGDPAGWILKSPPALEAIKFWLSDEFLTLRR